MQGGLRPTSKRRFDMRNGSMSSTKLMRNLLTILPLLSLSLVKDGDDVSFALSSQLGLSGSPQLQEYVVRSANDNAEKLSHDG